MSNIIWGIKYAVYPFDVVKDSIKLEGKIVVYDKGGAIVKLGADEWQFKNFQKAMIFVTIELLKKI